MVIEGRSEYDYSSNEFFFSLKYICLLNKSLFHFIQMSIKSFIFFLIHIRYHTRVRYEAQCKKMNSITISMLILTYLRWLATKCLMFKTFGCHVGVYVNFWEASFMHLIIYCAEVVCFADVTKLVTSLFSIFNIIYKLRYLQLTAIFSCLTWHLIQVVFAIYPKE